MDFIRMAGALTSMDERKGARAGFWGLVGAGLVLGAGLALLLWPRAAEPPEMGDVLEESSTAEYQGNCYVPVKKPDPEPNSLQP